MTGSPAEAQRTAPTGERFEPTLLQEEVLQAEHLVRYAWAAQFAPARRILDAGCGLAHGTRLLAENGASEIVGVDLDPDAIATARAAGGDGVTFEVADLRKLPFGEDEFDLIVCFEPRVSDPAAVIDEFRRVLRPNGLLVLSTPNRDLCTPANPFRLGGMTPAELESELGRRFRSCRLRRQHTAVASAVFDDQDVIAGDSRPLGPVEVLKSFEDEPGSESYTLALAGDGELPDDRPVINLGAGLDLRVWTERLALAAHAIESAPKDADLRRQAEVERLREELGELRRQLVDKEAELARYLEIGTKLQAADAALADYVHSAEIVNSLSWKVTRPLRGLIALLRKLRA